MSASVKASPSRQRTYLSSLNFPGALIHPFFLFCLTLSDRLGLIIKNLIRRERCEESEIQRQSEVQEKVRYTFWTHSMIMSGSGEKEGEGKTISRQGMERTELTSVHWPSGTG